MPISGRSPAKTSKARSATDRRWAKLQKLVQTHAPKLAHQGTIVAKQARGRTVWVLRFTVDEAGRHVRRSLYLGGEEHGDLIENARRMLAELRWLGGLPEELEMYVRFARRVAELARRKSVRRAARRG